MKKCGHSYLLCVSTMLVVSTASRAQFNTVFNNYSFHKNQERPKAEAVSVTARKEMADSTSVVKTVDATKPLLPVIYPPLASLQVNSLFGHRLHPIRHRARFHGGIDLKAHFEAVFSIAAGVVQDAGWHRQRGNYVTVCHGRFTSLYYHLSRLDVQKGERVRVGQPLGITGNTGSSTGPHLHFGLQWEGTYINPLHLLSYLYHTTLK